MTADLKAGKECQFCDGRGRNPNHHRARGWDTCGNCHGIGKVFAPGDVLTKGEADALYERNRIEVVCGAHPRGEEIWVEYHKQEWAEDHDKFRLAPAPQEEPAAKGESVEGRTLS